jgi:putative flavoprotein involved in K+ transport
VEWRSNEEESFMSSTVVIIGAGQAGLAMGHALKARQIPFTILDAGDAVGHSWRERWDSLTIFTPAHHSSLPGRALARAKNRPPTKNEVADYLAAYADEFALPVRSKVRVLRLAPSEGGYLLETSAGPMRADVVVVATGPNTRPNIPDSAKLLAPDIVQLHSADYRNPASVPDGEVLVVGAGTSGTQLAIELSAMHRVTIAGRPTAYIPPTVTRLLGEVQWRLLNNLLTRSTPVGRKAAVGFFRRGAPLIGVGVPDLVTAGVRRVGRFTGVRDGLPVVDGAEVLNPAAIVWATGYRPDFAWIDDLVADDTGWPATERGVASHAPGLYFVGMPFQYAVSSGLLGGVGRDAEYVAAHVARDVREPAARSAQIA